MLLLRARWIGVLHYSKSLSIRLSSMGEPLPYLANLSSLCRVLLHCARSLIICFLRDNTIRRQGPLNWEISYSVIELEVFLVEVSALLSSCMYSHAHGSCSSYSSTFARYHYCIIYSMKLLIWSFLFTVK